MVKVDNVFGDEMRGASGSGVYQKFYGRQIRRKREEKKNNDSPLQREVQADFKEGIDFASSLTEEEITQVKKHIRSMGWEITWHNFARRVVMAPVKVDLSGLSVFSTPFPPQLTEWDFRNMIYAASGDGNTLLIELQGNDISQPNYVDFSRFKYQLSDLRVTSEDGVTLLPIFIVSYDGPARKAKIFVRLA